MVPFISLLLWLPLARSEPWTEDIALLVDPASVHIVANPGAKGECGMEHQLPRKP